MTTNQPAPDESPTQELRPVRGWVLVWAAVLVRCQRLRAGARRHGPRLARAATAAWVDREPRQDARISDHAPVVVDYDL